MKKKKGTHYDQLMNNSPTTGSVASSGSSNITADSSGIEDGGDNSLLPHFSDGKDKNLRIENTIDLTPDVKARNRK